MSSIVGLLSERLYTQFQKIMQGGKYIFLSKGRNELISFIK